MPVQSQHQAKWLAIHRPDLLKKWQLESHRNISQLPQHVKKASPKKHRKH
jgi:hypothetical protein